MTILIQKIVDLILCLALFTGICTITFHETHLDDLCRGSSTVTPQFYVINVIDAISKIFHNRDEICLVYSWFKKDVCIITQVQSQWYDFSSRTFRVRFSTGRHS